MALKSPGRSHANRPAQSLKLIFVFLEVFAEIYDGCRTRFVGSNSNASSNAPSRRLVVTINREHASASSPRRRIVPAGLRLRQSDQFALPFLRIKHRHVQDRICALDGEGRFHRSLMRLI